MVHNILTDANSKMGSALFVPELRLTYDVFFILSEVHSLFTQNF